MSRQRRVMPKVPNDVEIYMGQTRPYPDFRFEWKGCIYRSDYFDEKSKLDPANMFVVAQCLALQKGANAIIDAEIREVVKDGEIVKREFFGTAVYYHKQKI